MVMIRCYDGLVRTFYQISGLCVLLIILSLQLFFSVRRESQTWDEANHIYAGYLSLTRADFGLNPEHPPLVKLLATLPLLSSQLTVPETEQRFFKEAAFLGGKQFLYRNDPEKILARTRTFAAVLALLTAIVVFFGTREMFGPIAAFVALTLLTFDPNFLAHAAFVTTDVGLSCFMFLSVYMFYRFVKSPSALRLIAIGISVGLVLAVKHTGLLILPILFLLALCEIVVYNFERNRKNIRQRAFQIFGSYVLITLIDVTVPSGLEMNPALAEYVKGLRSYEAWPISTMARWHVLLGA